MASHISVPAQTFRELTAPSFRDGGFPGCKAMSSQIKGHFYANHEGPAFSQFCGGLAGPKAPKQGAKMDPWFGVPLVKTSIGT